MSDVTGADMEAQRRAACRNYLEEREITPTAAARISGIPPSTLHSYLQGQAKTMLGATQEKLARGLGTTVARLFCDNGHQETDAPVWGHIGLRGVMQRSGEVLYLVPLPPNSDPGKGRVVYELMNSVLPPFADHSLAYFSEELVTVASQLGKPCLVTLADGRFLFKVLAPGTKPDRYTLEGWGGEAPIPDVEVLKVQPLEAVCPPRGPITNHHTVSENTKKVYEAS